MFCYCEKIDQTSNGCTEKTFQASHTETHGTDEETYAWREDFYGIS